MKFKFYINKKLEIYGIWIYNLNVKRSKGRNKKFLLKCF